LAQARIIFGMRYGKHPESDAYGNLLWDFYQGESVTEIVERDDGHLAAAPGPNGGPQVYFSTYKSWSFIEKAAMHLVRGRVLDIGCGAGRHSLHLQARGHAVVAIDSSPLAIKVCRHRGVKEALVLSINDIGKFRAGFFDSVILMGNNFGLFGSAGRARRLLARLHGITSRSGKIVAETTDPYGTRDTDHIAYHKWNLARGRMPGQLRLRIRHKKFISPWMDYLFVSENELRKIVKGTGWTVAKFVHSRPDHSARYLVVLAKE
jgi:SAM-dependent methyltransferase